MRTTDLSFPSSDGLDLRGVLEVPDGGARAGVLFLHGLGENRDEDRDSRAGIPPYVELSRALTAAGLACLRFDFRGHGESEGRFEDMTFAGLTADAYAALDILQQRLPSVPVGLVAASFAGIPAIALLQGGAVQCGVLWNPLVDIYRTYVVPTMPRQIERFGPTGVGSSTRVDLSADRWFGSRILDEMRNHTLDAPEAIQVPVLVLHGTTDTYLPIEASRALAGRHRSVEFRPVEGAEHGFGAREDRDTIIPLTSTWLAEHLDANPR